MPYKVFLVEDEIVTREGIRDSVGWAAAGYEFCGEAPDGEIALPLIQERRPDLVITDIKMPFMDGLQLCRIIKSTLPATKIVILSGHDEFKYAREAIEIGVTEYLLKPISAQDVADVLRKVAVQIEQERREEAQLQALHAQLADQRAIMREQFLLRLVTGQAAAAEVVEQCRQLDLRLLAPWYLVVMIRVEPPAELPAPAAYAMFQQIDTIVEAAAGADAHVLRCKKDLEETVLLLTGGAADLLVAKSRSLGDLIARQAAAKIGARVLVGVGRPAERIATIAQSFAQASGALGRGDGDPPARAREQGSDIAELLKLDTSAVTRLLKSGGRTDCERFFAGYLDTLSEIDHQSRFLIGYIFTDAVLSAASFIRELGGEPEQQLPELRQLGELFEHIQTLAQLKEQVWQVVQRALAFRDRQVHGQSSMVAKAKSYIDAHYSEPDISLSSVAAQVMLSPSYFSLVFGREVGSTFIEYLTQMRMRKAIELLRTTALTSSEIAYRVGYHNPRYFFSVFKKATGQSPIEFRQRS